MCLNEQPAQHISLHFVALHFGKRAALKKGLRPNSRFWLFTPLTPSRDAGKKRCISKPKP